ncbi:uncharacterized protein E0L32_003855 [Thyridium curvatum]|uniref:VPS9 domain-containing protein n=1 Tax=Thyridium curvatum TaxID=1093900 RepID=A0A507BHT8_9PEZI|nr:uncharacterized protein E0L32_003855 [Thyridium curvatum]TPX16561.1 hypothetical protein E0L32_003855 [Thyridium curvatum]
MQPLNPFLSAFFKSSTPTQCHPIAHHILLVPATDVLLSSHDTESGAPAAEVVASDDFLGSHVLRIPGATRPAGPGVKESVQNLRDVRGKAKPYNTINGRSVVIKDNVVYSNKGFKSLAQANIVSDAIWYADTLEPKPWLVYYISKPLIGTWEESKVPPALLLGAAVVLGQERAKAAEASDAVDLPKKKDIKSFHELLNHFPAIARQMQSGLEKIFREFSLVFEKQLPPPPSSTYIPDPIPDGPITTATRKARSNSSSSVNLRPSSDSLSGTWASDEDDENVMRIALETAVTTAIDLFQNVDKQQLSLLGATTDLTGPVVEKLIERYVAENIHHLLFPRILALKRQEDLELEAKIRQMEFIDISQLGIAIEGGLRGKHEVTIALGRAVEEFKKIPSGSSPQEMLDTLLSTVKLATQLAEMPHPSTDPTSASTSSSEKPFMTVNADTLVSLLLYVVIRAQTRHLQARFIYIRHFIFIEDVDSGEIGYALSTFEAVLSYLIQDSAGLRRASRRNKTLWEATTKGDLAELRRIIEPPDQGEEGENDEALDFADADLSSSSRRLSSSSGWSFTNGSSRRSSKRSSIDLSASERFSSGSGLSHVFPFQVDETCTGGSFPVIVPKRIKRVAMDTRSMSSGSEISFRSRATSIGTIGSTLEADTSIERLSQTQDSFGESILMMAIQHEQTETLRYFLSLTEYYTPEFVLDDMNHEDTTLFSAAVQLGNRDIISLILKYLADSPHVGADRLRKYFAVQDIWGRSVAHYLFNAPFLMATYGRMLPWRQKDKNGQTPLFALCRSYDHATYRSMVEEALEVARVTQEDGQPLHLDDHVDGKGNTLLHIVTDAQLALRILQTCDVNVNAANDKKFTPLMVASKYGRLDMVRTLFGDPRVDVAARELRGLTAVELAKDDDVRNRIDDLTLFSMPPGADSRTTAVVRSYFVEDASVRFVLKSGAPVDKVSYAVTTCRRSLTDFEHLAKLLAMENPASWIPNITGLRSPFQIPSKPSRATLKDLQVRMDWFLRILLSHPTFATHEMLWEFFLVPDLQLDMMEQRSKLKAETRAEKVRDEYEPVHDVREVEQFVDHARDMVRGVNYFTKSVARRSNVIALVGNDLYDISLLVPRRTEHLGFLPEAHIAALEAYAAALQPSQSNPYAAFHATALAMQSTIDAILIALARPPKLINQISATRRQAERDFSSLNRSTRWPLGLLDDTRQRMNEEREQRGRQAQTQADDLSRELRYSQQTVASELAGWQEMHERQGRRAVRELARGVLVLERMRLEGMKRALRKVRKLDVASASGETGGDTD